LYALALIAEEGLSTCGFGIGRGALFNDTGSCFNPILGWESTCYGG